MADLARAPLRAGLLAALLVAAGILPASAQESAASKKSPSTLNDFGGVGLLQTRTARMRDDGDFSIGLSSIDAYTRLSLTWQIMPWMEATFRYTDVQNRQFGEGGRLTASTQSYKDRGADLKFLLVEEDKHFPAVAVGVQDGLGTGLFSSEYIVASRRYYDLDFSVGLGWGYMANNGSLNNPVARLNDQFKIRQGGGPQGGTATFGNYFRGKKLALFGGVEYFTPYEGLSLKLEYDSNDYQSEPLTNRFGRDAAFNFGIVYQPYPWFDGSLAFERGNTLMARATLRTNLVDPGSVPKTDPPPQALRPRAAIADEYGLPPPQVFEAAPRWIGRESSVMNALLDLMEDWQIAPDDVAILDDALTITVPTDADRADVEVLRSAARTLAGPMPIAIRSAQDRRVAPVGVDRMFEALEGVGMRPVGFDIAGGIASVNVESNQVVPLVALQRAARQALESMPVPVDRLSIVGIEGGVRVARISIDRSELGRRNSVDRMFDDIEALGFEVEALDLEEETATLVVSAPAESDLPARRLAAIVADEGPQSVRRVTVVASRAGTVQTRMTLRRRPNASWDIESGDHLPRLPYPLEPEQRKAIAARIFAELRRDGFVPMAIDITESTATLYVQPRRYPQPARNIGRAVRVVANHVPPSVEEITIVTQASGMEIGRTSVMRSDFEAAQAGRSSTDEILVHARVQSTVGQMPSDITRDPDAYPGLNWALSPRIRQHIGGANQFYLYQLWMALDAEYDIAPGFNLATTVGANVVNNFDKLDVKSDSRLPHVRSDIAHYLRQGENNIVRLQGNHFSVLGSDVFMRLSAGIFEEMFGGFGGEVLYRPVDQRWAVGANLHRAYQRDFDQLLTFRDYRVTTGHLNLYYKFPWHDIAGSVSVGQYLAGDRGVTYRLSRRFDSGFEVGIWTTFTNVSSAEFGEGSFDKGFYVRIPFDVFSGTSSRAQGYFGFSPLTRDGGQMLNVGPALYPLTDEGTADRVHRSWHRLLD